MDSNSVATDDGAKEEKRDVSVIFVPESILLAISKSAEGSIESSEEATSMSTNTRESVENTATKNSILASERTTSDDNLNAFLLASQRSSLFVLDSAEWFAESAKEPPGNGVISTSKQADLNPPLDASVVTLTSVKSTEPKTKDTIVGQDQEVMKIASTEVNNGGGSKKNSGDRTQSNEISFRDGTKKYKCPAFNCNKLFKTEEEISTHVKSHGKPNAHPCLFPGCTWSFLTPYKLRRHAESHKQSKSYKCPFPGCNISCSTTYNLKVHEKFHSAEGYLRCIRCNLTYSSRMKMTKHLRTVHGAEPIYQCQVPGCDKKFHTFAAQRVHEKWHTRSKFVCRMAGCEKEFSKPAAYREHYMSVHSGVRPFKCDFPNCKWEFTTNAKLKRHALIHTDAKKYECPVQHCPARFFRKEHLRSHMRVHDPDNNAKKRAGEDIPEYPIELNLDDWVYYFCPYENCGSLFTTPLGAKQHILKVHTTPSKEQSENNSPSKNSEDQPLSVLSSEAGDGEPSHEIAMKVVAADIGVNQCEAPTSSSPDAAKNTRSILQTLMEAEPNTEILASENINTASLQATMLPSVVNLNFITTNSKALNVTFVPDSSTQTTSSPNMASAIDPSQFLLDTAGDFTVTSHDPQLHDSEALRFVNLQQSVCSTQNNSSIPDGFLNLYDFAQTVDPNAVMSLRSPIPSCQPTSGTLSNCDTSDDDAGIHDANKTKSDTSGSARTDCNVYQRRKIIKKRWPVEIFEVTSEQTSGQKAIDFDSTVNSFTFNQKMPSSAANNEFKDGLPDKDFAGSTINLSDLD